MQKREVSMTEQCKMLYKLRNSATVTHNKNAHAINKILSVEQVDENRIQIEEVTRTEGTNNQSMNVHCIR